MPSVRRRVCTGIRGLWFSIFEGVSAGLCAWLDPLGRLAKTCSVTEGHVTEAYSATVFPRGVAILPAGLEAP